MLIVCAGILIRETPTFTGALVCQEGSICICLSHVAQIWHQRKVWRCRCWKPAPVFMEWQLVIIIIIKKAWTNNVLILIPLLWHKLICLCYSSGPIAHFLLFTFSLCCIQACAPPVHQMPLVVSLCASVISVNDALNSTTLSPSFNT